VSEGNERGSVEVGRRVRLPAGAERPIKVYVNGIEKAEGDDYAIHGSEIVFAKPIVKERVSRARWLAMFIGLFGSYGENEIVDLHFRRNGQMQVRSDVEIVD
jgi:hypothetical protein